VRAIKDLEEGEEVTSEYLAGMDLLQNTRQRNAILHRNWNFQCRCSRCCQEIDELDIQPTRYGYGCVKKHSRLYIYIYMYIKNKYQIDMHYEYVPIFISLSRARTYICV
jgi:hypothetical protein